jgi:hypothetical protein
MLIFPFLLLLAGGIQCVIDGPLSERLESIDLSNGSKLIDPFDRFEPVISPIPLAKGTRSDCPL